MDDSSSSGEDVPSITDRLRVALEAGMPDASLKALTKQVDELIDRIYGDLTYSLRDALAEDLTVWVDDLAKKVVSSLLAGDGALMRRYLGCEQGGYNGRSDGYSPNRTIAQQHSIIDGKLREYDPLALRRAIVDAHKGLITDERIKDLEDQVQSLVAQVNYSEQKCQVLRQKLREADL